MIKEHTCSLICRENFSKNSNVVIGFVGEPSNPKAVIVFDTDEMKRKIVSLQDIREYEERPEYLKDRTIEKKGDEQDTSCSNNTHPPDIRASFWEPTEIYHHSQTGSDRGMSEKATAINSEAVPHDDLSDASQHNCNQKTEAQPLEIEIVDDLIKLDENQLMSSSPKRVSISDDVVTRYYESDDDFITDDEAPRALKRAFEIRDPVPEDLSKDPTYNPTLAKVPKSDRITRPQTAKLRDMQPIEEVEEHPIAKDDSEPNSVCISGDASMILDNSIMSGIDEGEPVDRSGDRSNLSMEPKPSQIARSRKCARELDDPEEDTFCYFDADQV